MLTGTASFAAAADPRRNLDNAGRWLAAHLAAPARLLAAALVALAVLAPDCCLSGRHVHAGGPDGLGAICFSRALGQ